MEEIRPVSENVCKLFENVNVNMNPSSSDIDGVKSLVIETVISRKSVMLFCSTKKQCEIMSNQLASAIASMSNQSNSKNIPHKVERSMIIEELMRCPVGICPTLLNSIPQGVAYHHSGLTLDERKIVEKGYRLGHIIVLCATSTLSAGVNLPAHRVIIKDAKIGNSPMTISTFRQMCGRAGRMGLDTEGEAILMIPSNKSSSSSSSIEFAGRLINGEITPLKTSLHEGKGGGIEKLILEMISCRKITSYDQIPEFIRCTLFSVQHPNTEVHQLTMNAIKFLRDKKFIRDEGNGQISSSQLGRAATLSGLSPKEALAVFPALCDANHMKLILKGGGLHLVFLVTPPATFIEPNWDNYEKIIDTLIKTNPEAQDIIDFLKVDRCKLIEYKLHHPRHGSFQANSSACTSTSTSSESSSSSERSTTEVFYRRLYSALILFSMIQEVPIVEVLHQMSGGSRDISKRGELQQLQKDASSFCRMTVTFCEKLNWTLLSSCLEIYSDRLSHGVRDELLPLVRLGSIEMPSIRARKFYEKGIKTPLDIVQAGKAKILEILISTMPFDRSDPITCAGINTNNIPQHYLDRKDVKLASFDQLAVKIIMRAKQHIAKEIEILNSIK